MHVNSIEIAVLPDRVPFGTGNRMVIQDGSTERYWQNAVVESALWYMQNYVSRL